MNRLRRKNRQNDERPRAEAEQVEAKPVEVPAEIEQAEQAVAEQAEQAVAEQA